MKIQLNADLLIREQDSKYNVIQFAGKVVEAKKEIGRYYVFDYEGTEYKIKKRYTKIIKG
jgi:hypothetical protein